MTESSHPLLWRPSTETDIDAELRFHFDQKVADLVARGAMPDSARAQAVAESDTFCIRCAGRRASPSWCR